MKTKHTPGPWLLSYPIGHDFSIFDKNHPNGRLIATIHENPIGYTDEHEANANLIVTVPELLEAVEGFLNIVANTRGVYGYHLNGDPAPWSEFDEVYMAVSALKKATA